jgi:hypothetical protein
VLLDADRLEHHEFVVATAHPADLPVEGAILRAQAIVRQYLPEGRSLVDELIAERRAEAARD